MTSATQQTCNAAESEAYVLGCVLRQPDLWLDVISAVNADAFSVPKNRQVFEAMKVIAERGELPDVIMVSKETRLYTTSSDLAIYSNEVGSTALLPQHIEAVRNAWRTREIVAACNEIESLALTGQVEATELIDRLQSETYRLSVTSSRKSIVHVAEIIPDIITDIGAWASGEMQSKLAKTGFSELDKALAGFLPGDLIILAGRPSHGKSQLGLQIAMHTARLPGQKALIVSLEMSRLNLGRRALVTIAKVDGMRIKKRELSPEDWDRLTKAQSKLAGQGLYFLDDSSVSVADLRGVCRRMATQGGLNLLVVDYLQLMAGDGRRDRNREQEVAAISRGLKSLAMEIGIPVLVLSQLSRTVEQRADKEPKLSDLRESGALEQDADIVLFVHHAKSKKPDGGGPQVIVGKYRDGKAERVRMGWHNGQWCDMSHKELQENAL